MTYKVSSGTLNLCSINQCVPKRSCTRLALTLSLLSYVQNSFTAANQMKFTTKHCGFLTSLKYVAALPCEVKSSCANMAQNALTCTCADFYFVSVTYLLFQFLLPIK